MHFNSHLEWFFLSKFLTIALNYCCNRPYCGPQAKYGAIQVSFFSFFNVSTKTMKDKMSNTATCEFCYCRPEINKEGNLSCNFSS